jgi:uncharacterized membrane protein YjjP (DUF1212 family)
MALPQSLGNPRNELAAHRHPAREAEVLVEDLARALHRYGTPSHRFEEAMALVARRLGLKGQFFSTPTAIFASFGEAEDQHTRLLRLEPGEVNLEKLSELDRELDRLVRGRASARLAAQRVAALVEAPPRYGSVLTTLAFGLASGTAASFLGGGLREAVAATVFGLLIGLLVILAERLPAWGRLFEPGASFLAATLATATAAYFEFAPLLVILAGLIVLVPGLTLTTAITELAQRHLASGSARLSGAMLTFLTLGFGVAFGTRMGEILAGGAPPTVVPQALPPWVQWPALVLAALSFTVLFRAHPRDCGWIFLAAALALTGARWGAAAFGPELGAFAGALLVGVGSNIHARLLRRPSAITQLPGLMLLVPGSMGFRSVAALVEHDTLAGVQTAFAMSLVAVALAMGLLVANAVMPPRRVL